MLKERYLVEDLSKLSPFLKVNNIEKQKIKIRISSISNTSNDGPTNYGEFLRSRTSALLRSTKKKKKSEPVKKILQISNQIIIYNLFSLSRSFFKLFFGAGTIVERVRLLISGSENGKKFKNHQP